jgi:hypothetical protein
MIHPPALLYQATHDFAWLSKNAQEAAIRILEPVNVCGSIFPFYNSRKPMNSFPSSKFLLSKGNTAFGGSIRQGIIQGHATTVCRHSCTKRWGMTTGVLTHYENHASIKLHQEYCSYQGSVPKILGLLRQGQADSS